MNLLPQPKLEDFCLNERTHSGMHLAALVAWENVCREIVEMEKKKCQPQT